MRSIVGNVFAEYRVLPCRRDSGCFSEAQAAANVCRDASVRVDTDNHADANMWRDCNACTPDSRLRAVFSVQAEPGDRQSATESQPDMQSFLDSVSQCGSPNVWSESKSCL